jgi:hypothetical protein
MMDTTKLGRSASRFVAGSVVEVGVVAPVLLIIVGLLLIRGGGPPI